MCYCEPCGKCFKLPCIISSHRDAIPRVITCAKLDCGHEIVMMMKLIWDPHVWYDLSWDDTPNAGSWEARSFRPIIKLSCKGQIPFFAAVLSLFFRRCHNLAITPAWKVRCAMNDVITYPLISCWDGFIMLWLMPAKNEKSNKKCSSSFFVKSSAENERFFRCIFFEIFLGLSLLMVLQMKHFILYATLQIQGPLFWFLKFKLNWDQKLFWKSGKIQTELNKKNLILLIREDIEKVEFRALFKQFDSW